MKQPNNRRRVLGSASTNNASNLIAIPSRELAASPSASEVSIDTCSSHTSDEFQTLVCPICNESMLTLLQLNRHLDDVHAEVAIPRVLSNEEQLKSWFKKNLDRAKQNSGFSKPDMFTEPEETGTMTVSRPTTALRATKASEDNVTKSHWQKRLGRDICNYPGCRRAVQINCRKCGKLYCAEHTMFEEKLSKEAAHDPENGYWCRVCEQCYESREGYDDISGFTVDRTTEFGNIRQSKSHVRQMERNRLEKRLITLIRELSKLASQSGLLGYGKMGARQAIERSVAEWQDDSTVDRCPICKIKFSYSLRKHHCRVCGKVVCGDLRSDCSREVILSFLAEKLGLSMPASNSYGVRLCRDCKDVIFSRTNFARDIQQDNSTLVHQYSTLVRLKRTIDTSLPKFQATLLELNDPKHPPSHEEIQSAGAVRRKLLQSFSQYDALARKIASMPVTSETERHIQQQIYHYASQYLHDNMLPLKSLPKVLKHASSDQLEAKNDELHNQLIVMEEQKYLVQSMMSDAKSRRKFDELMLLERNVADLDMEIDKLKQQLGNSSLE